MSVWLQAAVTGYLLLVLQGSSAVVEITERRIAAEGSSVLMHAPDIKNVNFTEWEYIRNTTPEFILQYYADHQALTIYSAYQGRVIFYPENGSILLQSLRETDSGIYKATVDLMQDKARTTLLEVIKPVPQPELQCSSNLAGSLIELVCVVPEGTVASISWKKERLPLSPEKCYLLPENITMLRIRNGDKSDCGSYSCNVSNVISWKEAALNLTVTGLTPPLYHAQRLAGVALMFVAVSATSFMILFCQLRDHRFGVSVDFIFLGLFFFTSVIQTAWRAAAVAWRPVALSCFKIKMWCGVIWNSTAPTTLIVNFLFTIILLCNIQQLHERGCSEGVDLISTCVFAAVAAFITLPLLLLWCYRNKRKEMKNQHATQNIQVMATSVMEEIQGPRQEDE
ncbi:uncharacterized protein LOC113480231 isoform X2 [Athene cunicularia]|uniref:uncharacterized protein LOC113480231 isoform X2 n=1 Tax=Athene cunicularia TaxID=194338 RepID=UPI000EF655D2|nr:uncharacterized protein LOC113480231 isoform X2 [Athene cunicularia]